jgi:hypothetical protein
MRDRGLLDGRIEGGCGGQLDRTVLVVQVVACVHVVKGDGRVDEGLKIMWTEVAQLGSGLEGVDED